MGSPGAWIWTARKVRYPTALRIVFVVVVMMAAVLVAETQVTTKQTTVSHHNVARLNTDHRIRFISHLGECVENCYLLKGYGLPIDSFFL
jgi:hypothetical protein